MHQSDKDLAQAAATGDAEAFHALIDRHAPDLFRLALSLSRKRADAEDICQETFIGAFRGIGKFNGTASIKTWLTRILLRNASKTWKKNRRRNYVSSEVMGEHGSGERHHREPQAKTTTADIAIDLVDMIARLGPDHREIVVLRERHGMSYDEIAQLLDIPRGTVESRLYRARAELRKLLKDYEP